MKLAAAKRTLVKRKRKINADRVRLRYQTEFGFTMPNRKILVNDVRVRGVGKTDVPEDSVLPSSEEPPKAEKASEQYKLA